MLTAWRFMPASPPRFIRFAVSPARIRACRPAGVMRLASVSTRTRSMLIALQVEVRLRGVKRIW
jgi:hypothetical protein